MARPDQTRTPHDRQKRWHFDVIVANGFVVSELAAIVDVLRIANRVSLETHFTWSFHSTNGGLIDSPSGVSVQAGPVPDRITADFVFVLGNADPCYAGQKVFSVVSRYRHGGAKVYLLAEAATRYIQECGADSFFTTHWENLQLISETMGAFTTDLSFAKERHGVVTCAGMGSTADLMLELIGQLVSPSLRLTVADIFLHETVRHGSTMQPYSGSAFTRTGDDVVDRCIQLMQCNIEEPLRVKNLASELGVSNRLLERKFERHLKSTPYGFYRRMRLAFANNLLLNSSMSVQEIGMACGFTCGFSGVYKRVFGLTPAAMRNQNR